MPLTYHRRNYSPGSDDDMLASSHQEPPSDDSIVLSDLIRIGETSRLRRRGAMRLEPTGTATTRQRWRSPLDSQGFVDAAPSESPYSWTIIENRPRRVFRHLPMLEVSDDDLEDSDSDSGDEMIFSAPFNRFIPAPSDSVSLRSRSSIESVSEKPSLDNVSYTLVCGGSVDGTSFHSRTDSESVYSALASFILPDSSSSHSPTSSQITSPEEPRTDGCGAVIHARAFPRYRHHQPMWTATAPATEVVVPLEKDYFDEICTKEKLSKKMIKKEVCGCLRIGVGCSNCGNPLGFQLTPCKTLREQITSRQSRSRRRNPASSSSASDSSEQGLYLYTFFCNSTTSPETPIFPAVEPSSRRHRDRSRPRTYPLLPPPPPLIRLMSDSEMSDSDEEVAIDFRTPGSSSGPSRILGGDVTASPEPTVIRLEPNPTPFYHQPSAGDATEHLAEEEDTELGQARASWANVVRGIEADASSLGTNLEDHNSSPDVRRPLGRLRRRRDALGFEPERELGLALNAGQPLPSNLFEQFEQSGTQLIPPRPPLVLSTTQSSESEQNTPRPAVWDVSFADGHPSTSFWGRPASGSSQWTWGNELESMQLEREREREREADTEREREGEWDTGPTRLFDPDGEFLEGLEGEWGEDMARRLGFNSTEEKNEGNDAASTGSSALWWS